MLSILCFGSLLLRPNIQPRSNIKMSLQPQEIVKTLGKQNYHQYSYNELIKNLKDIDSAANIDDRNVAIFHDKFDQFSFRLKV